MSEYITAVGPFAFGQFYRGPAGTLLGAQSFAAVALFMMTGEAGPAQTIWANRDAAGRGWEIRCNPSDGRITVVVQTVAGEASISVVPDTNFLATPVMVMLGQSQGEFIFVLNGVLVGRIFPINTAFVPAVGSRPTIGCRNADAPESPAQTTRVLGVGYAQPGIGGIGPEGFASWFWECRQAKDLTTLPAPFDTQLTNYWSAKRGNSASLTSAAVWKPEAGTIDLERVGASESRGWKDLDWHYSFDTVESVNPA